MLKAVKVRLYPTPEQQVVLSKSFGCARWYWNYSLNACIQHYQGTGKALKLAVYKGMLPQLKKEHPWLKEDCYSSVLQCVAINLNKAYKSFFQGRAKFPRFKSKQGKQSIQYPQNVTLKGRCLSVPKLGEIKAVFHREIAGTIKTVTISKTPSDKYFVKGMVQNRKLSKAISDVGWGMFVNFLSYKLERKNGKLVEIDRFFPSSKKCSCCGHVIDELPLDIREWDCTSCGTHHDRDGNAALNIRAEGIRILSMGGGKESPC